MKRAHPALFPIWFEQFLPRIEAREPATLFTPAIVSDRSDGKIAHLDGLNLSRAWCWRSSAIPSSARRTSPPPCRTSPATIWANIGCELRAARAPFRDGMISMA
jgi:hypothetical protein